MWLSNSSIGRKVVMSVTAVSYTHLDVYKRQVHAVPPITASNSVPTSCAIWPFFVPMCW